MFLSLEMFLKKFTFMSLEMFLKNPRLWPGKFWNLEKIHVEMLDYDLQFSLKNLRLCSWTFL